MTTANDSPTHRTRPTRTPLRTARARFLTGLPLPDDVPAEVAAAWRRARFFGVPPDRTRSTHPARTAESPLMTAARPVLERLAPALSSGQSSLLLTDERLRVLWSGGNAPDDERCRDLSEQQVGHNSAALALRERRRAEVHGPEHFLDLWQDVSAVSVPVLAPENGRVLGTVTVASGLCTDGSPHPEAALAEVTATAVEAELLTRSRTAERVLLDTLAARSVALPALRERPGDIVELLPVLTPGPAPGEPPLTWSLDALHALERHPWPGNVTELTHLVRALAERRRTTGPVRRAELPDAVREGPATRPLSPMEHAERTAILEALRSHGGNKARAAEALGIARATLYRKLRAYRH